MAWIATAAPTAVGSGDWLGIMVSVMWCLCFAASLRPQSPAAAATPLRKDLKLSGGAYE
jgi:hypothetical protein